MYGSLPTKQERLAKARSDAERVLLRVLYGEEVKESSILWATRRIFASKKEKDS